MLSLNNFNIQNNYNLPSDIKFLWDGTDDPRNRMMFLISIALKKGIAEIKRFLQRYLYISSIYIYEWEELK